MSKASIIALAGIGALAIGGVAYAASRDEDGPPFGSPDEGDVCSTSDDVGQATTELLADSTITADGYRKAADVLENWTTFCDDNAKQTGMQSAALLRAKANLLEPGPSTPASPGIPSLSPGSPWPVLPGYSASNHTTGLHGDMGTVYEYPNGDMWFYPDNPTLVPYYIPGGSKEIQTSGHCMACEEESY